MEDMIFSLTLRLTFIEKSMWSLKKQCVTTNIDDVYPKKLRGLPTEIEGLLIKIERVCPQRVRMCALWDWRCVPTDGCEGVYLHRLKGILQRLKMCTHREWKCMPTEIEDACPQIKDVPQKLRICLRMLEGFWAQLYGHFPLLISN